MTGQLIEFRRPPSDPPDPRWQTARKFLDERRNDKALEVFEDLAEDGFVHAYFYVGACYEAGRWGVSQDLEMARYWYMQAIDAMDDEDAYIGMARLALAGFEDAGTFSDAADYLQRACDKDSPRAMTMLASLYQCGKGVNKDLGQAARLCESAIAHGYVLPMLYLSRIKLEEGAYLTWIRLRLKVFWMTFRIFMEDENDDRLWNLKGD